MVLFISRYRFHLLVVFAAMLTGLLWGFTIQPTSIPFGMLIETPMVGVCAVLLLKNMRLEGELDEARTDKRRAWTETDRAGYTVHELKREIAKLKSPAGLVGSPLVTPAPRQHVPFDVVDRPVIVARAIRGVLHASGDPVSAERIAAWASDWLREREPGEHPRITVEEATAEMTDWPAAHRASCGGWTIGKARVKA